MLSWDILIYSAEGLPDDLDSIPEGWVPKIMGDATHVKDQINDAVDGIDWSDPKWGIYNDNRLEIEFNLQVKGPVTCFLLSIRGSGDPLPVIISLCDSNGWVAIDTSIKGKLVKYQEVSDFISQSISYFKGFGFFGEEIELNSICYKLIAEYMLFSEQSDFGHLDQILLSADRSRVWSEDWEIWKDSYEEYKQAIFRWGEISRGTFNPEAIQIERDEKVEGVITVRFKCRNEDFSYRTDSLGFIDPIILVEINKLPLDSGIRFYACDTGDQTAFIVCLDEDEYKAIKNDRGWKCDIV